ncbi:hypothetical protein BGW41_002233 [Actinomortierella wolfii]|nr:hypothetical protein BGW41_002233 [Actinomortierella wolfii]
MSGHRDDCPLGPATTTPPTSTTMAPSAAAPADQTHAATADPLTATDHHPPSLPSKNASAQSSRQNDSPPSQEPEQEQQNQQPTTLDRASSSPETTPRAQSSPGSSGCSTHSSEAMASEQQQQQQQQQPGKESPVVTSSPKRLRGPKSLPAGSMAQAQAQMATAIAAQLQVTTTNLSSPTAPTLNLVPATPGPLTSSSTASSAATVALDPSASSLPTNSTSSSNPPTLSKHKGLPVQPFLVTPKEEKTQATIWDLWEPEEVHQQGKASVGSNKSASAKVVTSMGAEAGRKALLALQSVAAEEGSISASSALRRRPSAQQLAAKFTILAPTLPASLSVVSAPVSPYKDREGSIVAASMAPNPAFESISLPTTPTASENRTFCLPDNGFFLAVMSVYWSNLMGPRIEQVWTPRVGCPEESVLAQLAKQVLNGEMMRNVDNVEPKMVVLQEEASPSSADGCQYGSTTMGTTTGTLAMPTKFVLSFVVPLAYLENFSTFFGIMSDHAPVLIEVLRGLRSNMKLAIALDIFAEEHLVPFVEDVMTIDAVAMAVEGAKVSHIALGKEGDQVFGRDFINKAITSHLQTHLSTVVVGNNITIMNMMINTLALFLSAEERAKSCHARKQHRYIPDLYLQGIYTPSVGKTGPSGGSGHVDGSGEAGGIGGGAGGGTGGGSYVRPVRYHHILCSRYPTTIVDTVRCTVEQTEGFPGYAERRSEFRREYTKNLVDRAVARVRAWSANHPGGAVPPLSETVYQQQQQQQQGFWTTAASSASSSKRAVNWTSLEWKGQKVVKPVQKAAPMIEELVRCVVGLPIEMREGYVRQWRRGLMKRALVIVKFVRKEGVELAESLRAELEDRIDKSNGEDEHNLKQEGHSSSPDSMRQEVAEPSSSGNTPGTVGEEEHQQDKTSARQRKAMAAQALFQQLGLGPTDLSIVLGIAERLLPCTTEFVKEYLCNEYRTVLAASSAAFDSVKTRMQTHPYKSIMDCVRKTYIEEGMGGFFRGMIPPLVTVSIIKSISFSVYEGSKQAVRSNIDYLQGQNIPSLVGLTFISGGVAGAVVASLSSPLELVKLQRQLEKLMAMHAKKGYEIESLTGDALLRQADDAASKKKRKRKEALLQQRPNVLRNAISMPALEEATVSKALKTLAENRKTMLATAVAATTADGKPKVGGAAVVTPSSGITPATAAAVASKGVLGPANAAAAISKIAPAEESTSSWKTVKEIVKRRGIFGLYKGAHLQIARDTLGTGVYFASYETVKRLVTQTMQRVRSPTGNETTTPSAAAGAAGPGPMIHFFAGGFCGVFSWMVVFPIDLVKSVMQKEVLVAKPTYHSAWACAKDIVRRSGIRGLYRGVGVTLVRSFPIHSMNFVVYEAVMEYVKNVTGHANDPTAPAALGGLPAASAAAAAEGA